MAFGIKKQAVIAKPSFKERLIGVKSMFKKAHEDAAKLSKDFIEGEDRILRGYKMQFVSRDGKYKCLDMDIERNSKEDGIRLVNINTIKALVFNGVKYVVE